MLEFCSVVSKSSKSFSDLKYYCTFLQQMLKHSWNIPNVCNFCQCIESFSNLCVPQLFSLFISLVAPEKVRISSYDAEIRFSRPNPNLRIAVAHVTYVVGFNMSSSVTGRSLWQLKMFASENEDGTGRNQSVSEQILAPNQMSADARAGGQFTLQTGNRYLLNPFFFSFVILIFG